MPARHQWTANLSGAPKLDKDGQAVIVRHAELLSHRFPGDPVLTVTATHAALTQAHLTQTIQRIASDAYARACPGTANAQAELLEAATDSLSTAGVNSELLAAHLEEAPPAVAAPEAVARALPAPTYAIRDHAPAGSAASPSPMR